MIDDTRYLDVETAINIINVSEFNEFLDTALAVHHFIHVKELFLDHDLGWDKGQNKFVSIRIITPRLIELVREGRLQVDEVFIVTANPVGRKWLTDESYWINSKDPVHVMPGKFKFSMRGWN